MPKDHPDEETTRMLSSALQSAFGPADVPIVSSVPEHAIVEEEAAASAPTQPADDSEAALASSVSAADLDKWREELDRHSQVWKAENAEARAKAEANRARYESIRAEEDKAAASSSSVVPTEQSLNPKPSESSFTKWAMVSPEPSISYPSRSESLPTPESVEHTKPSQRQRASQEEVITPAPISTALAVFDPDLPIRTRVLALAATLGINLFLPFLNGVMLGFGEIFAKNIVNWAGWSVGVAQSVGIRKQTTKPKGESEPGAKEAAAVWSWKW